MFQLVVVGEQHGQLGQFADGIRKSLQQVTVEEDGLKFKRKEARHITILLEIGDKEG